MNVSLTTELEQLVQDKVQSGLYLSASEVVRDALRLLQERDQLRDLQLQEMRRKVAEGLDQLDRGEFVSGDEVFHEIQQKSRSQRTKG